MAKTNGELEPLYAGSRNPHECAVAKKPVNNAAPTAAESQPARMRCGKARCRCRIQSGEESQPARMRCGKERALQPYRQHQGRNPHECAVAKIANESSPEFVGVATRTNALWQRWLLLTTAAKTASQPARMRCGKGECVRFRFECRTSQPARMRCGKEAVIQRVNLGGLVATHANALWQRLRRYSSHRQCHVATRANALWQRA